MAKIALIHDWLNQLGGAEDVLEVLHAQHPAAPVFTSIYDRVRMPAAWHSWDIRTGWLNALPLIQRKHQPFMPLFAWYWANRRIPAEYDVLLSNKSAFCIGAHGVLGSKHLCYCLTPTRFTYDFDSYAQREAIPAPALPVLRMMNAVLRRWETQAAQRVTKFVAISREIQERIRTLYGRESELIHPPVNTERFKPDATTRDEGYLFIVSRLLPYKRIDLAIEACNRLGLPLLIAGAGRDAERLRGLAGSTVKLLGRVSDAELHELLSHCRAFLFPGREDFGIAPLQAAAYGKPVIAFGAGGALDTVIAGKTGLHFAEQTVDSLSHALQSLRGVTFVPDLIRAHAETFSVKSFTEKMSTALATL